jgi:acetylxylan esterase
MKPVLTLPIAISAAIAIALASTAARAASLTGPVGGADAGAAGYTTANLPSYVSMYEYVPAKLAAHPPVLVVSHWYGATAAGMFGVAQGGGLVAAADQYGFIMVFPQRDTGGCWDISSTQSLTHDGGGETQAIAEMVKYEVAHRGANANRVYATGQSCGAMFTEALLAYTPTCSREARSSRASRREDAGPARAATSTTRRSSGEPSRTRCTQGTRDIVRASSSGTAMPT